MATPRISPSLFPVPAAPAKSIGKYDIQAEAGTGSLVKEFRAFDRALGRAVTLKVVTASDAALKERFRQEVALAGKLRSDSFIAIYDLGDDAGRPFAAMQVTADDDLARAIAVRPMSLLQRVMILWQVSEGLAAAHAGGLKQVGLRTSGIAVDENCRAMIRDFGIVSANPPNEENDIFSFGTIAAELLTGSSVPEELQRVIRLATERDPDLRYPGIDDLCEDLDPILGELKHKRCASLLGDASEHLSAGRLDQAQPLLKEVLQLEPDNRKAQRLRTEVRTQQQARASESKRRLDRQLGETAALVASQQYNRAIVMLCDLSREFRGDAEIARRLDEACELRARQEAVLEAATASDALLHEGQVEQAIELLDNAIAEYPGDPVLTAHRKEAGERQHALRSLAEVQKVLDEVQWVLSQDRPDLAAQLLREKVAANPHAELSRRLAEVESLLPRWEEARYVAETLPRVTALEELEQWTVALTVLEEALQQYPAAPQLLAAAERLRTRLTGEERRRKVKRRLDSIQQKMSAQAWAQALMLIEAAQSEFPDELELERLRQSAEESRRKAEGESIVHLVRQCLEDGEPERAGELLQKGLATLPADSALLSLQQEVNAAKRYREEWRNAQVLFGRRQFLDAEKLLARLAAPNRPEVDLLLQKVREAKAATQEDDFYSSGLAKARKLIQQQHLDQAFDLLQNLLGLFPGDVILQRELQSVEAARAKPRLPAAEEPAPVRVVELTAAPAERSARWRYAAVGVVVLLAGSAAIWKTSRTPTEAAPASVAAPVASPVAASVTQPPQPAPVAATAPSVPEPAADKVERTEPRELRSFSPPPSPAAERPSATMTAPLAVAGQRNTIPSLPDNVQSPASVLPPPPPPAVTTPVAPEPAPKVGGNAVVAQLIYGPAPVAPPLARQNNIRGVVLIRAIVDTQGLLREINVVGGSPVLVPAAREAVQRWRYRPATLNGTAVESNVDIKVSFRDR